MEPDHRLGPLRKSDLQYEYPESATDDDDPSKRGTPDESRLNRSEWYEVLYFCNRIANEYFNSKKDVALRIERLLKDNFVPANLQVQYWIEKYIFDHWMGAPE